MLAAGALAVPASGASTAYGAFTVTNTGATVTTSGTTFPVLSLATTAAVGTNYELLQTASSGSAPFGYALFDVVAAPPVAPNAPTGMTATGGYSPLEVVWSWTAPTGGPTPDGYNLYTGQFPGYETLRQSGITGLSFTDTAVALRVPNSGYVKAVSGGLEGPASLRAVLTLLIPPAGCSQCPPMF